jgi:hypothetical protein
LAFPILLLLGILENWAFQFVYLNAVLLEIKWTDRFRGAVAVHFKVLNISVWQTYFLLPLFLYRDVFQVLSKLSIFPLKLLKFFILLFDLLPEHFDLACEKVAIVKRGRFRRSRNAFPILGKLAYFHLVFLKELTLKIIMILIAF